MFLNGLLECLGLPALAQLLVALGAHALKGRLEPLKDIEAKVADLVTLRELVLEDATDAAAKDFQAEYDGSKPDGAPSVHVQLIARVGNAGDRRMLGHFEADARQPATANRLSAIVDAYDRAANQALLQIAADCAAALAPDSKAR